MTFNPKKTTFGSDVYPGSRTPIHTLPQTNMDTQNDAIFEAGDTFKKTIIHGIYVRFRDN